MIALLSRALAFDPKLRPTSVDELSGPLAADAAPVAAAPPSPHSVPTVRLSANTPSAPVITIEAAGSKASGMASLVAELDAAKDAAKDAPAELPPPPPPVEPRWVPPTLVPPWMPSIETLHAATHAHRLLLSDTPIHALQRRIHFANATDGTVVLNGTQGSRVRVTLLPGPGGNRVVHVKGLTCFVSLLGGRPSPAVQLDRGADLALVTPRAQEIGHIRVATGSSQTGQNVFPIGGDWVAVGLEDCADPILFDFGPGSDAYLVYTRGRALPKRR